MHVCMCMFQNMPSNWLPEEADICTRVLKRQENASLGVWNSLPALRGVQLEVEFLLRGVRKLFVSLHGVHLLHLVSVEPRHHGNGGRDARDNRMGLRTWQVTPPPSANPQPPYLALHVVGHKMRCIL